jgi:pyridoxal phosphate enzyme (YggS family)
MKEISSALADIESRIAHACRSANRAREDVRLIAVTKTHPIRDVEILQSLGIKDFGENRDSEGAEKSAAVTGSWHYQGQIQSKKISSLARWSHTVHSVDDLSHLQKFDRALDVIGDKTLEIFIQVSLDGDPSRAGVREDEVLSVCQRVVDSSHLKLMGVMTVPPVAADPGESFSRIATIADRVKSDFPQARYISAGMSGDFEEAIAYGATHIRIGSQILGSRRPAP